ncbi:MAG: Hpt domain-containing protein [Desulfatibacillaceae bacterium]
MSQDNKPDGRPPVLDTATAMDNLEVDEELFQGILEASLSEIENRSEKTATAMAADNMEDLSLNAHTIKSAAATIGARALQQAAENLELAARKNRPGGVAALHEIMDSEIDRLFRTVGQRA